MGTWGTGLFSNDAACDLRDHYRELLEDGVDDAEAIRRTLVKFHREVNDPDDGPLLIVALAVTQSKVGRLDAAIRTRALAVLDSGADLARWRDENLRLLEKRRAALDTARAQLTGPQPKRKTLRAPKRELSGLAAGDVLMLRTGDRCTLLRVVAVRTHRRGDQPTLEELAWDGREPPPLARLEHLPARPSRALFGTGMRFDAFPMQGVDWQAVGFEKSGRVTTRPGDDQRLAVSTGLAWAVVAARLRTN